MSLWRLLFQQELAAWSRRGHSLCLWWRDDDAQRPTPQLDRLLALAEQSNVPLTLAVIPSAESRDLARRALVGDVTIIQHGIDHVNRAKANERIPHEMPLEWDALEIAARLDATRLQGMPNSIHMFVPPWHAVHPCLETALRTTGFKGWSAYGGDIQQSGGLVRIDVHLEVLRWKAEVRFRGEGRFTRRLTRLARERRCTNRWMEPIGLLTHHLEHDEASWVFLEHFIPWATGNAAICWWSLPELLEKARDDAAITAVNLWDGVARVGEADAA